MAINPNLLIAAPMLQDYLVDKDGTPMAGGTITCYQDDSRTTLKNWYYQSSNFPDSQGKYTFSKLPNPLTLSAAGTITDINGVDTIPFFYPFSELDESQPQKYYITIVNAAKTNQITRPNFPFISEETPAPPLSVVTLENLIINNGFWRNFKPNYVNQTPFSGINLNSYISGSSSAYQFLVWNGVSTLYGGLVAPSQFSAFAMPNIQFIKNNLSATDTLTFTPFPLTTQLLIQNTTTPEYYINHVCSAEGSSESVKCYQFPIAMHLNNLSNYPFTVSIQAQNAGGTSSGQNVISLNLLQFTGTGTTSPTPHVIAGTTITLNPAWTVYSLTDIFPSSANLTLSMTEDDAWYLQVQMPLNVTCNINFTKPSLYLTDGAIPENDFLTYDQVDSVISLPRTGDIRTSLNGYAPFGWVPCNDGTIGTTASAATNAGSQTWPLYNLIWNSVSNTYAPVTGGRGSSAYADFITNKPMALTKTLSRMIGEAGSGLNLPTYVLGQTTGAVSQSVTLVAANIPQHTHNTSVPVSQGTGGFGYANGTLVSNQSVISDGGASLASVPLTTPPTSFSIATVPPGVFYNMFFKL